MLCSCEGDELCSAHVGMHAHTAAADGGYCPTHAFPWPPAPQSCCEQLAVRRHPGQIASLQRRCAAWQLSLVIPSRVQCLQIHHHGQQSSTCILLSLHHLLSNQHTRTSRERHGKRKDPHHQHERLRSELAEDRLLVHALFRLLLLVHIRHNRHMHLRSTCVLRVGAGGQSICSLIMTVFTCVIMLSQA